MFALPSFFWKSEQNKNKVFFWSKKIPHGTHKLKFWPFFISTYLYAEVAPVDVITEE